MGEKNTKTTKKTAVKKSPKKWLATKVQSLKKRQQHFMQRRPHRSFRRTRSRDYQRSFSLPGYWAFTFEVWEMLWKNRRIFLPFVVVYAILVVLTVGLMSQENYAALSGVVFGLDNEDTGLVENVGGIVSSLSLFATTIAGSLTHQLGESQQVMGGFLALMGWLIMVWLLRQLLAGHPVRLRDGIYTAGAPIAASLVIVLVIMFQLIPVALALLAYNVFVINGFFANGVEAMIAWAAILLIALLSLYWMVSSFIALIIVTLPGMYPFAALKSAGDMVVGRRLRLTFRIGWLILGILPLWAFVLIPLIFIQGWLKVEWLPLVPVGALVMGSLTIVWVSAYIYLLYRKLIDDPAPPA